MYSLWAFYNSVPLLWEQLRKAVPRVPLPQLDECLSLSNTCSSSGTQMCVCDTQQVSPKYSRAALCIWDAFGMLMRNAGCSSPCLDDRKSVICFSETARWDCELCCCLLCKCSSFCTVNSCDPS